MISLELTKDEVKLIHTALWALTGEVDWPEVTDLFKKFGAIAEETNND